jgi:hypothetical protein
MRRTYISPEFNYSPIWGTFNMQEESSIFASKMLEIEDMLEIHDQSLVYFQNSGGEQLDLIVESSLPFISYSSSTDKLLNHVLKIDESQTESQRLNKTRWIIEIDLRTILINYIFATLKRWRTFEGVRNSMVKSGDVSFAIKEYVIKNVLDRYRLSKIELFLNYVPIQNQNSLRFNSLWASETNQFRSSILISDIVNESNKLRSFQTMTEFDFSKTTLTFSQEKSSSEFCFDYYFKLFYEKI